MKRTVTVEDVSPERTLLVSMELSPAGAAQLCQLMGQTTGGNDELSEAFGQLSDALSAEGIEPQGNWWHMENGRRISKAMPAWVESAVG